MTTKDFCTITGISDAELAKHVNNGWQIQFMQFMPDAKLHVVFVRDVVAASPAPAAPTVEVVTVTVKPIESVKLPAHICIMGLDEPVRSVPLTRNGRKHGDTRPVSVPKADPVMEEALSECYRAIMRCHHWRAPS